MQKRTDKPIDQTRREYDEPKVGRSPSTAQLLPSTEAGGGSQRAAAARALLEDCDEEEEDEDEEERGGRDGGAAEHTHLAALAGADMMDGDAQAIYGMRSMEDNGPSPRYDLPHDLGGGDPDGEAHDDIGPDDSISVAWFKAHTPQQAAYAAHASAPGPVAQPRAIPVTIEAPDGSRHAMDVELDGLQSMAELRVGMLQGYCELLGVQLPAHALRVHARLASGSTTLLLDSKPLQEALGAVSFYVWADAKAAAAPAPAPMPVREADRSGVPSIAQRKQQLVDAMHTL